MIKNLIQNSLRIFGLELRKILTPEQLQQLAEAEQKKRLQWLIDMQIKTVLDIGANTGQFVQAFYKIFPDAMIYSFEPLSDCYEALMASFGELPRFKGFNMALGNQTGKVKINRNEHSPSSSLLPMTKLHKQNYPFTQKEVVQEVSVARLDDVSADLELHKPILIKLDVQGFEDKVIDGGMSVFNQASVILIEMSIENLYEGQVLFDGIYQKLVALGFQYRGNYQQSHSIHDGRVLQVDGIFTK